MFDLKPQNPFLSRFADMSVAQLEAVSDLTIQNIKTSTHLIKSMIETTAAVYSPKQSSGFSPTHFNYIPNLFRQEQSDYNPFPNPFDMTRYQSRPFWPVTPFQAMQNVDFSQFPLQAFHKGMPSFSSLQKMMNLFNASFPQTRNAYQAPNIKGFMMFFEIPMGNMRDETIDQLPFMKFYDMFPKK